MGRSEATHTLRSSPLCAQLLAVAVTSDARLSSASGAHAPGGAERPALSVRRGVVVLLTGCRLNVLLVAVPLAIISQCVAFATSPFRAV